MGWWRAPNVRFLKLTSLVMSKVDVRARSLQALTSTFDITDYIGFKKHTLGLRHHTYMALADELLVPYVWYCLLKNIDPDISGCWNYCDSIKKGKYIYTQEMTFTYLHVLMLLQKGICMNSSKAVYICYKKSTFKSTLFIYSSML